MKPSPIKKIRLGTTDNYGVANTTDVQEWFDSVTDVLNYLLDSKLTQVEQLAADILKMQEAQQ